MTPESLEAEIDARARASGIVLAFGASRRLAAHARLVLDENAALHLTSIKERRSFVERHLGESFEGAALLDAGISGTLVDLGSGNGYPGIPIAIARPGLEPVLVESSSRKAEFLRRALVAAELPNGRVLEKRVQRAGDLEGIPPIEVLVTRAAGGWEKVVPRLRAALRDRATVLIWAGKNADTIVRRASWRGLELVGTTDLPGRLASRIYRLRAFSS